MGVGHHWLLRLALDGAPLLGLCCIMDTHCGVWGITAQRRDPQQAFLWAPFNPHNWLLTKRS